ncbi:hypothetical protein [Paenibacillus sp. FSL L8-0709]|uniref:hypothetical protein n=1 Tax=Paenibacillus sp. FSL L8-0709 TaxID=2975312 RepID=UPI0030FAA729
MGQYLTVFATKVNFDFDQKLPIYNFDYPSFSVQFRRISTEIDKEISCLSYGWFLEVTLIADTIQSAITIGSEKTDLFLSTLCLETGVEVHRANIILACDITEEVESRDFIQYFYDRPFSRANKVNLESLSNHLDSVLNYSGEHTDRLFRSIRWFRRGVKEDDAMDQFLALWQGLETLNPLLAQHYGCDNAGKEIIERTCCKTGATFYSEITNKEGLQQHLIATGFSEKEWKKIVKLRNSISHGFASFTGLTEGCINFSPDLGNLLYKGIIAILGMPAEVHIAKQISNIAPIKPGECIYIHMKLLQSDYSLIPKNYSYPYVTIQNNLVEIEEGFEIETGLLPHFNGEYISEGIGVSGRGMNLELI